MQNDTITISRHHANDPAVKLAICHALAQVGLPVGSERLPSQSHTRTRVMHAPYCCHLVNPTAHSQRCLTLTYMRTRALLTSNNCLLLSCKSTQHTQTRHPQPHTHTRQSTKLCIHEERVLELVLETKHMPQAMAEHGTVNVTSEEVAQRIGQVFIQRVRADRRHTPNCAAAFCCRRHACMRGSGLICALAGCDCSVRC
jgi:hypothetical protein